MVGQGRPTSGFHCPQFSLLRLPPRRSGAARLGARSRKTQGSRSSFALFGLLGGRQGDGKCCYIKLLKKRAKAPMSKVRIDIMRNRNERKESR